MADFPKYYSGLINVEMQAGATAHFGGINHYTSQGDVRTYDFSHLIPAHNDTDENNEPLFLIELTLPSPPIKESFMLMLDGVVLSPQFAVDPESDVLADYRFKDDITVEFLFTDGLRKQSADDTPVLLARYSRR
jgi:hypothetical protein